MSVSRHLNLRRGGVPFLKPRINFDNFSKFCRLCYWCETRILDIVQLAMSPHTVYVVGMTVEALKNALTALPQEERQTIAVWLNELDYDEWDREIVQDFSLVNFTFPRP